MAKTKAAPAPAVNSGSAIELTPLLNKAVAICCISRKEVNTSFGPRQMSQVRLLVAGETEPLEGVLFQSYFQRLPLGEWFVGKVIKSDRSWGLDSSALNRSEAAQLNKAVDAQPDLEDVPF